MKLLISDTDTIHALTLIDDKSGTDWVADAINLANLVDNRKFIAKSDDNDIRDYDFVCSQSTFDDIYDTVNILADNPYFEF